MAAALCSRAFFKYAYPTQNTICLNIICTRKLFGKSKTTKEDAEKMLDDFDATKRKLIPGHDGQTIKERLNTLREKGGLTTKRAYKPPSNYEERIADITKKTCQKADYKSVSLEDAYIKYKLVSRFIEEFDHDVPASILTEMKTVADCVEYFGREVKRTSALEDMKQLDLPKNLSIMYEYKRFDPETDTFFDGVTAFPGRDTYVRSLKYKRKYKNIITTEKKPGYANHYYGY
ncbi:unnamed protein product [Dimorphilus gyrociliatus]|uniref:Large ribosomal subunit protein mL50 n=1 Tax=Dimorphilus gyrociliatus TaxID=2664684 RepID=A0A7I8W1L6_9ANNE|nr:unnamed protein product [Dimorphilus gyrociliatus]